MYTPGQVSKMLNIPPSTLRRYAATFAAQLSEHANKRRRSYTDQDIITLEMIRDLASKNVTLEDITPQLNVMDQNPAPAESALAKMPNVIQAFDDIRSDLAQVRSDQLATDERLSATDERIDNLNDRMDQLIDLIIEKLLPPE